MSRRTAARRRTRLAEALLAASVTIIAVVSIGGVGFANAFAGAAPRRAANCPIDAKDQSAADGATPVADAAGHVFPLVTIHGITGSNADFEGTIDLSMTSPQPLPARSVVQLLSGTSANGGPAGLPHVHVYSFEYTKDSLNWVDDPMVGGRFANLVDCLYATYGEPVMVLAHSMGGLVTRWVANTIDDQGVPRATKIGKVVTLGTPYEGSDLAAAVGTVDRSLQRTNPALWMLAYLCGLHGTATGSSSCGAIPLLTVLDTTAGRALQAGSPQLQTLARWPRGVDAFAIAGSSVFTTTLFGATLNTLDVGDVPVSTRSAQADAAGSTVVRCDYTTSPSSWLKRLKQLLHLGANTRQAASFIDFLVSQPCYHGNLMRNVEVTNEVLRQFAAWLDAQGATAAPTPTSTPGATTPTTASQTPATTTPPTVPPPSPSGGIALPASMWHPFGGATMSGPAADGTFGTTFAGVFYGGLTTTVPTGIGCDYRLEGDGRVVSGDGYGFVARATIDPTGTLFGRGVQYDIGVGGARDVLYPNNSENGAIKPMPLDANWHHVVIEVTGSTYRSLIDGQTMFTGATPMGCGDLVLRVWRSSSEFRNVTIVPLAPGSVAAGTPHITAVTAVHAGAAQDVTITGSGFGTLATPFSGVLPCFELADVSAAWAGGHIDVAGGAQESFGACDAANAPFGDLVTASIDSWTDTSIHLTALGGSYGAPWHLTLGDVLAVRIANAHSGAGPAAFVLSVT
jgi:pimeloyl-ACP methyl ester carboxylesterase